MIKSYAWVIAGSWNSYREEIVKTYILLIYVTTYVKC
jgi:hypothetical protein